MTAATADTTATPARSIPVRDQSYPTIWWHVGCGYCESKFGGPFVMTDEEATAAFNAARIRAREHVRTVHGDGKRVRAAMRGEIKAAEPETGKLTEYQRGYVDGFDAPANTKARDKGAVIPEGELRDAIADATHNAETDGALDH